VNRRPERLADLLPGVVADLAHRHTTNRSTTMTALDRAKTYAAIFLNAGDRWRNYVPVDATVTGDTVHLGGVRMERNDQGWRLETNGEAWVIRVKAEVA
jgi:hypothetical protein